MKSRKHGGGRFRPSRKSLSNAKKLRPEPEPKPVSKTEENYHVSKTEENYHVRKTEENKYFWEGDDKNFSNRLVELTTSDGSKITVSFSCAYDSVSECAMVIDDDDDYDYILSKSKGFRFPVFEL